MDESGSRVPADYVSLLAEVTERVRAARYAALRAVNNELVGLYWDIGRLIVERQIDGTHGDAVVERLTRDLQAEFPGIAGFSRRNVFYMREFYLLYRDLPKVQPLVAQIGWTHNLTILQRCKEPLEREFYIRMTRKFGWTKNVLMHQIENQSYRKYLLGQTNFDRTVTPELRAQANLAVRDEYTFDFLELGDEHSERELEKALIARVEDFLRAMGGMFAFLGSQFRLEVDGDEYFIDLLLFHRRLRCLVAVDLKIGKFQPEFVGKMQFLDLLLRGSARVVVCPARSIENMRIHREWRTPISDGRLLILSSFGRSQYRATAALAAQRNALVAALATEVVIPYAAPGGKTESLARRHAGAGKSILTLDSPANANLIAIGASTIEAQHSAHQKASVSRRHPGAPGP